MIFRLCLVLLLLLHMQTVITEAAVRPPPWADPKVNPCADKPRGWQYIYWPADGQCYKIYQIGYPCPETMELVPAINKRRPRSLQAECRCPPTSILYEAEGRCYEIYKNGPCQKGQYFAPQKENTNNKQLKSGICKNLEPCASVNEIYWPATKKCYRKHSQGPCLKGQLLVFNSDRLPICACSNSNEMKKFYWEPRNGCYEHYTKGPCQENGHLFLPNKTCDCHPKLPHYHPETKLCYELGTTGPCKRGHQFKLTTYNATHAQCKCKDDHIIWLNDGKCYRPFTQGPCPLGEILINSTICIPIPCSRNSLYFPEQKTCYRVGSQGPCSSGQIVTFDLRIRPSVDGISYNGICGCSGPLENNNSCSKEKRSTKSCDNGMVLFKNNCYKLYMQGPCSDGQWLVPNRQAKVQLWQDNINQIAVRCDCKPGYTSLISNDTNKLRCLPPSVSIANYLNQNYLKDS